METNNPLVFSEQLKKRPTLFGLSFQLVPRTVRLRTLQPSLRQTGLQVWDKNIL